MRISSHAGRCGDVRVVYSPLDAVKIAQQNREGKWSFWHRFEDDCAGQCDECLAGQAAGVKNYSMLVSHVRVPPAMRAILSSPYNQVQAFLAAGTRLCGDGLLEYRRLPKNSKCRSSSRASSRLIWLKVF